MEHTDNTAPLQVRELWRLVARLDERISARRKAGDDAALLVRKRAETIQHAERLKQATPTITKQILTA